MTTSLFEQQLSDLFGWREPNEAQFEQIVRVRTALRAAAKTIIKESPYCVDQDRAIVLLRQAGQMAVSAILNPTGGRYVPLGVHGRAASREDK